MSSTRPLFVTDREADELRDILDAWRADRFGRRGGEEDLPPISPRGVQTETVMLLEDLREDTIVEAEKLTLDTLSYTLDVLVLGYPPIAMQTFPLLVNGVEKLVPLNATADEFAKVTGVKGSVTLGSRTVSSANGGEKLLSPARWRITWGEKKNAELLIAGDGGNDWFSRVSPTLMIGTSQTCRVIQTIPTGWDTPLKSGAICEVVRGKGEFYKLIGAEARLWSSTVSGAPY